MIHRKRNKKKKDQAEVEIVEERVEESFALAICEDESYNQYQNDVRQIFEMSDTLKKTIEPILFLYNAAISETVARLEIIKNEFSFREKRCPIHHIDSRLKSGSSIVGKLEKKSLPFDVTSVLANIKDIAGVRVVCPYLQDVYVIRDRIAAQDDVRILEEKDYIQNPKESGYRSLHLIIQIPIYFMNKKQQVPVEIQIRTQAMDMWASLEHDIRYKTKKRKLALNFSKELMRCSEMLYEAEASMERMNRMVEE